MLEGMAKNKERGIGHRVGSLGGVITEDEPRCGTRAGFGQDEVG